MFGQLLRVIAFYCRFLLSFSQIGFSVRRLYWPLQNGSQQGKTWLITGASGGIGRAVVEAALASGATVIAVARSAEKLQQLQQQIPIDQRHQLDIRIADLSLQGDIHRLLQTLAEQHIRLDVLINNVGVMFDEMTVTQEGVETSFATNLLNQYLLTQLSMDLQVLANDATVITVASGGLYYVPLTLECLNDQSASYNGVVAYAYHKRGQAVLTRFWRETDRTNQRQFYVMHPGWVDTDGVKKSLPRFRQCLKWVLRDAVAGADTIVWLATNRPEQVGNDVLWFDRKPRKTHCFRSTIHNNASSQSLVDYLQSCLKKYNPPGR